MRIINLSYKTNGIFRTIENREASADSDGVIQVSQLNMVERARQRRMIAQSILVGRDHRDTLVRGEATLHTPHSYTLRNRAACYRS